MTVLSSAGWIAPLGSVFAYFSAELLGRCFRLMILAIAALLLHLGPATDVRVVSDAAAVVTSTSADPTTAASPQPMSTSPLPVGPTPTRSSADPGSEPARGLTTASLADAAEDSQSFDTLRLPDPTPAKPIRPIPIETTPPRKSWLLLAIAQHGAGAFDAYTTREAVSTGAHEDDPFIRPFANSPAIYAVSQFGPTILDYAARRMQRSQHAFLRHSWWLPQSAGTALFVASGTHNLANIRPSNPDR